MSSQREPTFDFCAAIAGPLGKTPEEIFRLAGLLPPLPAADPDPTVDELLKIVRRLKPLERIEVLKYAQYRLQGQVVAERDVEIRIQILEILEKKTPAEREALVIEALEQLQQEELTQLVKDRFFGDYAPDPGDPTAAPDHTPPTELPSSSEESE